ncbi:polysialyltransferase family glycosyltransferase [Niallia alba]|uniref:polysialyltransferase family glycosyltransferase n=1 Tax=Niallia alba TaxID=2729105 RepID=UPI002E20F950|nr:polysialyltransferase family glycosyltransferase [Niallia alba]
MKLYSISSPLIFYFSQSIAADNPNNNIGFFWNVSGKDEHIESYNLMKDNNIWFDTIICKEASLLNNASIKNIIKFRDLKEVIDNIKNNIENLLIKYKVEEVFIGNRFSSVDRLIYSICKKNKIPINLIEDGMSNYLSSKVFNEKTQINTALNKKLKSYSQRIFDFIISEPNVLFNQSELMFNNIYAVFPQQYSLCNFSNGIKELKLKDSLKKNKDVIKKNGVYKIIPQLEDSKKKKVLFLSQSLSEDYLISQEKEIEIICDYINQFEPEVYTILFKPHPRDSKEKVKKIVEKFENKRFFIVFNNDIPIPIELLLGELNIDEIVGIWSATLFYTSKLNIDIKTVSLLPLFSYYSSGLKLRYEYMKSLFPNDVDWYNEYKG